jgi:hypothetical protein
MIVSFSISLLSSSKLLGVDIRRTGSVSLGGKYSKCLEKELFDEN